METDVDITCIWCKIYAAVVWHSKLLVLISGEAVEHIFHLLGRKWMDSGNNCEDILQF